jgi:hypothetical protein
MTSPLLRLFAVFWWLLVIGSAVVGIGGLLISWADYHSSREYTAYQADLDALAKLPRVLPDTISNQQTPFVFKPDNPVPPETRPGMSWVALSSCCSHCCRCSSWP